MKKMKMMLVLLLAGSLSFAANFSIVPAAGMPTFTASYNGNMVTAIDVSQLGGGLACYEIYVTDIEYTLAGWEFRINFPADKLCLDNNAANWNAPSTALPVFTPGPLIANDHQQLPADANGMITTTTLNNGIAEIRIGGVWTEAASRPVGSVGTPNAGGLLGTLCFQSNCPGIAPDCYSTIESVRVFLTQTESAQSDIFADDTATRRPIVTGVPTDLIGLVGRAAYFGSSDFNSVDGASNNPVKWADGNGDGVLNAIDALTNITCSVLGIGNAGCIDGSATAWNTRPAADYRRTFDANCDNVVNAVDALRNLQGALILGARGLFKNLSYTEVQQDRGQMVVKSAGVKGAMANVDFTFEGLQVYNVQISAKAQEEGWLVVSQSAPFGMSYILVNATNPNMTQIPTVTFDYERTSKTAQIAIGQTIHQRYDRTLFDFVPQFQEKTESLK